MDNYNGQNQYVQQQYNQMQQAPQMQYQQMPQNMQYQQMPQNMQYQQMPQNMQHTQPQNYNNGYVGQVNNAKPKKKKTKMLLLIGIPVVVAAIVTTILLIILLNDKYDIKDASQFVNVCKNTLDIDIEKQDLTKQDKKKYALKSLYSTGDIAYADVSWCEFDTKEDAKVYLDYMTHIYIYSKEYRSIFFNKDNCGVNIEEDFVDAYGEYNEGDVWRIIIAQEDEYCVYVRLRGTEEEVERKAEKFLNEITE